MSLHLKKIRDHFKNDLKEYDQTFSRIMTSDVRLVDQIAKYIVKHRGKGLRPLLVLMTARLIGQPNEITYTVSAIVELLHTATLIHDDVVDDAMLRRNFPSVNALWKNKISVLMGDYLLAKTLINATQTGRLEIMRILAESAKRLSKGELFQIEKSRKLNITESEYFKLISDKTAALISACCELGAMSITDDRDKITRARNFGENIGIAFQITDDLLDYEGRQSIVGKPVGADLKGKKITLPLILSMESAPVSEKKHVIQLLKKGVDKKDVQSIIRFTEKYGGLAGAKKRAAEHADLAKQAIINFSNGPDKDHVLEFVDYVINRKK